MIPTKDGAASALTYTGSASAIASGTVLGFTASEWSVIGVLGGLFIALLGYVTNAYFKYRHLRIAEANKKADPDE